MSPADDDELVSRREADEELKDAEYLADRAIGKMEDRAIIAEEALRRAQGEIRALQSALDQVRGRAEKAEGLLSAAVDVLCDRLCPPGPCPTSDGVRQTPDFDRDCRPCWREELNRRLAEAPKQAAETQGR